MAFGSNFMNPSTGTLNESWEDNYSSNYEGIDPFQNWFSKYMGEGVDVYDSGSIVEALSRKYDVEGLHEHMFPSLEKGLAESALPESYDAYKQMMRQPQLSEYRSEIAKSAGILNPNKRRMMARNRWVSGMQDINEYVTKRTSLASGQITNWMQSALQKVMRMKY